MPVVFTVCCHQLPCIDRRLYSRSRDIQDYQTNQFTHQITSMMCSACEAGYTHNSESADYSSTILLWRICFFEKFFIICSIVIFYIFHFTPLSSCFVWCLKWWYMSFIISEVGQSYCNTTWDDVSCWPTTLAGTFATVHCPSGVDQIDVTREYLPHIIDTTGS